MKCFFAAFQSSFVRNSFFANKVSGFVWYIMAILLIVLIVSVRGRTVIAEPGIVKIFQFPVGKIMSELSNGSLEIGKFGFQKNGNVECALRPVYGIGVNVLQFIMKDRTQLPISNSFVISDGQFNRVTISRLCSYKNTNNSTTDSNHCYFKGTHFQFYLIVFASWLIGIIISFLLITWFFSLKANLGHIQTLKVFFQHNDNV